MAGGATALTITTALGVAVVLGMGGHMLTVKDEPLMFTVIPDQPMEKLPDVVRDAFNTDADVAPAPKPALVEIPTFEVEETRVIARTDPLPSEGEGTTVFVAPTPPKPPGVRTAAKIIPGVAPPYPSGPVRRGEEGVSVLEVCLDARGVVTSAKLATSSGYEALDDAALKWVHSAKFTPAKLDGVAQAVCGHSVSYEWSLSKR
jgi:protein TonB